MVVITMETGLEGKETDLLIEVTVRVTTGDGRPLCEHEMDQRFQGLLEERQLERAERVIAGAVDCQIVGPIRAAITAEVAQRLEAVPFLRLDRPHPHARWPEPPDEDDYFSTFARSLVANHALEME